MDELTTTTTTWGLGDYSRMAERLEDVARRAVRLADVQPGDRVLDVACGTGNGALLAARREAKVVGIDSEPKLLEIAARRAEGDGHPGVQWREGDAAALPVPDGSFDVVLSIFGAMYAADQAAAAAELGRACAPGARLALAGWAAGSFLPAMGAALAPYLPEPTPESAPQTRWGDGHGLAALLAPAGIAVEELVPETVVLEFASRAEAVDFLIQTAGHILAERPRLEAQGSWESLLADLGRLVQQRNDATGEGVSIRADYLLALGRIPAKES